MVEKRHLGSNMTKGGRNEKFLLVDLSSAAKLKAKRDCQKSMPFPEAGMTIPVLIVI